MNPIIRGWANYFMNFNPSEAKRVALKYVNLLIVNWAMKKYKHLRGRKQKANKWLTKINLANPKLFHHWQLGVSPTIG